jgi:hypothetical protein
LFLVEFIDVPPAAIYAVAAKLDRKLIADQQHGFGCAHCGVTRRLRCAYSALAALPATHAAGPTFADVLLRPPVKRIVHYTLLE